MQRKVLATLVGVLLLAACSSDPEPQEQVTGGGETQPVAAAPTESAPAPRMRQEEPRQPTTLPSGIGDRVFFAYDQHTLSDRSQAVLRAQAEWLQRFPNVTVIIEGHCDERGTREYNLALGERRASSVKDYLVALGVSPGRVETISYGKERPAREGSDEASWAENRRGVTIPNS